ncbi:unnamed protein product [Clonostachys chloroleuca]|uniref:Uncharacterized protein n=1 Tax=Clonostachys chloroleuca TaxID=1926264 RepID=A0AA35LYA4_9HYPO|nr:unnamed protein product [Clonostachys chloroleuca]
MEPKKRGISEVNGYQTSPSKLFKKTCQDSQINGQSMNGGSVKSVDSYKNLKELFSPSVVAKVWGIAQRDLNNVQPPHLYPEYTKPGHSNYVYRELEFWTSGFFPGSLHLLLERQRKYRHLTTPPGSEILPHPIQLDFACKWWTENLHQNAMLLGTHDLGFMIYPWARVRWELDHDHRSFDTMMRAAGTLADRFSEKVGAIRSWDTCMTKVYHYNDLTTDFLVIIDNMMNLDLMFWAAANHDSPIEAQRLYKIAVGHARMSQQHHVAGDFSTRHVVNFDPETGRIKEKITNQGYSHDSCWARGQAWAIAGFAQTAQWTGDDSFLQTAIDCADYFIKRLPPDTSIPPWDFDAPLIDEQGNPQPTDTSAGLIAAYGMLIIHDILRKRNQSSVYLESALQIVDGTCENHLNERAVFMKDSRSIETVEHGLLKNASSAVSAELHEGDTIVNGATINNFEHAPRRWASHGLVYADYYYLLVGNKLLEMGVGEQVLRQGKQVNGSNGRLGVNEN